MQVFDTTIAGAFENLRDKGDAKALLHAIDAGKDHLSVAGDVALLKFRLAAAAVVTGNRSVAAEVVNDEVTEAFGCVTVIDHLLKFG